jgi:glycosyltransferase involved in cell wall biosynthesis
MSKRRQSVLTAVDPHLNLTELTPVIHDLYTEPGPYHSRVLLAPADPAALPGAAAFGYNVSALAIDEDTWAQALTSAVAGAVGSDTFDLVHCPQLGAPITHALVDAFPPAPRLGIVHPVDLQRAQTSETRLTALRRDVHAMNALAVPAAGLANMLLDLVPGLEWDKFVSIPFAVPDHLLDTPPLYSRPSGRPRVLCADQSADSKDINALLRACNRCGAEVTLAISSSQFDAARDLGHLSGAFPAVVPDLSREKLHELLSRVDVVAAPGSGPLAFSRTALEAQARGVPVICQIGSCTSEILPGAVAVDFADPDNAAEAITSVCTNPGLRGDLRSAARGASEDHRLSAIQARIAETGIDLLSGRFPATTAVGLVI